MEYELKDTGPCKKNLVIKFNVADTDAAFDESYGEINNHVQLKGFRKGKAPRRTLEKRFAAEAAAGVKDHLTEKHVSEIIKKDKLNIIGNIVNKKPDDMPVKGQPFELDITLDVAPEFELPAYTGLELSDKPVEVSDADVDEALERYRKMFANYETVSTPAEEDDVLKVDFVAKVEGREIMNMTDKRLRIEGDVLFGLPCPDLKAKFVGAKPDDKIEITVTMPHDHPEPDLRDKPANIEVKVLEVERGKMPEMNDAFAEGLGMGSLAAFRGRIKENLVRERLMEHRNRQEEEIVENLTSKVTFEIPEDIYSSEADALMDQRRQRLQRSGVEAGEIAAQLGGFRPEALKLAERKVRWGIVASKIGEKEGITVTNEDLNNQIEALAASYRTTPAKIIQRIREFNGVGPMASEILSIKVVQYIIDHAKGGKLDPEAKDSDTEHMNAAAAASAVQLPDTETAGQ